MSGDLVRAPQAGSPGLALDRILAELGSAGILTEQSRRRLGHVMGLFAELLESGHGGRMDEVAPDLVRAFVDPRPGGGDSLPSTTLSGRRFACFSPGRVG